MADNTGQADGKRDGVPLRVDVIGGTAAGADPAWHSAILTLRRRVNTLAKETDSPVDLGVLFHVPGMYHRLGFDGARMSLEASDEGTIRVDVALPDQAPDSPQHHLHECLVEAVWLAEQEVGELAGLRSLIRQL